MIGILSGKYAFPKKVYSVDEWCAETGQSKQLALDLKNNGIESCYYGTFEEIFSLAVQTTGEVIKDAALTVNDIDALVLCHTPQFNVLYPPMSSVGEIGKQAGLERAVKFSVAQQNCASPVHALKVLRSLFKKNAHWNHAILLIMDAVQVEELRPIDNFGLHSDGVSALIISRSDITNNCFLSLETYNDYNPVTLKADNLFDQSANYVWAKVSLIRKAMKAAGVKGDEISSVLPHNVNNAIWLKTLDALRIPREKLYDQNFACVGHVFGADFAINLLGSNALNNNGKHLGFTTGVGGCLGAFVLDVK
ncbi:3-oxoacyl-[acyl-carrier-protein] synthase III C-terminal domain-containing protein [Vibrio lentus]|uniref:3-oxoacyl-[acyl-carrier-protein] synthase III C-terminal domain-containing protein n=1 Tax=Vibrio lentus TaxID=136468 RepID=UPI000C854DFD|nr:3-oxoacyl-[acyl-carrier-protein] synthase III C-terminal domain-containing protein [Vibrio lentus]PMG78019.1 hypothetical protein BCU86_21105 [Vibrio lentus]